MIGSLRGEVLERDLAGSVLIEVGGVGYVVNVSPRALAELEPSTPAFLYVHHHIREDTQQLFGFLTRDERATFQTLIATHGVGPALAMAILATHPPAALVDIPHFCAETGHALVGQADLGHPCHAYLIRRR